MKPIFNLLMLINNLLSQVITTITLFMLTIHDILNHNFILKLKWEYMKLIFQNIEKTQKTLLIN